MRGINKVILLGTLGKDPEGRSTTTGTYVTHFSVATNESFKNKKTDEWEQRTEWHNIVCFGKNAENAEQYLKKGSKVYIEGSIRTEKWQDKEGKDRYTTKVYANDIQYLDSREGGAPKQQSQERQAASANDGDDFDSDIPF